MKRRSFSYYLGTGIIIVSLLGFAFTFYPLIRVYLFPTTHPAVAQDKGSEFSLVIPKINAVGLVKENVDPFNTEEYTVALKEGIAHAKGTYLPGEKGTVFLFAHSSGLPWELTRYNTIFLRLGELEKNDSIQINYKGTTYEYKVRETKKVWPNEVNFLLETEKEQLILQTCTPIGTDLKRLLIFADPVKR